MRNPKSRILLVTSGALASVFLLLAPLPSGLASGLGPFGAAFKDALHFPLFAVLTGFLFFLIRSVAPALSRPATLFAAAATCVLIALGTEWFQGLTGRSASIRDLFNDALGISATMAILLSFRENRTFRRGLPRPLAAAVVIAAATYVCAPVYSAWKSESLQRRLFPDLGGFTSDDVFLFWRPQGDAGSGTSTSLSLQAGSPDQAAGLVVNSAPASWSGVSKSLPAGTRDWTPYSTLSFSVTNSGPPFVLGIRLDSESGSGSGSESVSAAVPIETGLSPVLLPFDSKFWQPAPPGSRWLSGIRKIVLHTGESPVAHPFVLTDIRLLTAPSAKAIPPPEESSTTGKAS